MMTLSLPRMRRVGAVLAAVFVLAACTRTSAPDVAGVDVAGEELAGGMATIFNTTPNAFGQPAPGLEREDELLFFVGNSFFNQNWVQAPASTTARDGLGPLFNSRSCAGCHFKDGRGRPPAFQGELPVGNPYRILLEENVEDPFVNTARLWIIGIRFVKQCPQQDAHRQLAAAIDARVQHILDIEFEIQPGASIGNNTR